MNRENRRHPGAGPERVRHSPQRQEQEDRRGCVQDHVGQMMAARFQIIKLAIQHVRQPRERMPVGSVKRRNRPGNASARQARLDMRILIDVVIVVEVNEFVVGGLAKDGGDRKQQKAADGQDCVGSSDTRRETLDGTIDGREGGCFSLIHNTRLRTVRRHQGALAAVGSQPPSAEIASLQFAPQLHGRRFEQDRFFGRRETINSAGHLIHDDCSEEGRSADRRGACSWRVERDIIYPSKIRFARPDGRFLVSD